MISASSSTTTDKRGSEFGLGTSAGSDCDSGISAIGGDGQFRSLRRFPENSSGTTSPSSPQINNRNYHIRKSIQPFSTKPETAPKPRMKYQDLNSNTSERRKTQGLASSPTYDRRNQSETSKSQSAGRNISRTEPSLQNESDGSFNHLISSISPSEPKSVTRVSKSSTAKEADKTKSDHASSVDKKQFLSDLLDKGSYLCKYTTWSDFRGPVETEKVSDKVLTRYNNIWELISQEYNYLRTLVKLRDVYTKSYPYLGVGSVNNSAGGPNSVNNAGIGISSSSNISHNSGNTGNNILSPSAVGSRISGRLYDPSSSSSLSASSSLSPSSSSSAAAASSSSLSTVTGHGGSINQGNTVSGGGGPNSPQLSDSRRQSNSNASSSSDNLFGSIETLLPGLDPLIECHSRIVSDLVENQLIRPDRICTNVGRVLNDALTDEMCASLAKLYGVINYTHQHINQKLAMFNKYPCFTHYLLKCERDPQLDKKGLKITDWLSSMGMHWTKTITTMKSLVEKTLNDSQEKLYLTQCRDKIHNILKEASRILETIQNEKQLQNIIENYEITNDDSKKAYEFLINKRAKLINFGKIQYETHKKTSKDVMGVALENCLFFLQSCSEPGKNSTKYQLFTDKGFPPIVEWGKYYGFFREITTKVGNNSFGIIFIIAKPIIVQRFLYVSLVQERNMWNEVIRKGFSQWQEPSSALKGAETILDEDLMRIKAKWTKTLIGLDVMKNLDNSIISQLECRTASFQCILEEELKRLNEVVSNKESSSSVDVCDTKTGGSHLTEIRRTSSNVSSSSTVKDLNISLVGSTDTSAAEAGECYLDQTDDLRERTSAVELDMSVDTYIPDLSTPEGISDCLEVFLEWVNRLKFGLYSSGSNITRSASEIEARKRPSIQTTVKKCETFSSRESSNTYAAEKRDDLGVNSFNQVHQNNKKRNISVNKDQRRISVSGLTNFFRINSKNTKHEEGAEQSSATNGNGYNSQTKGEGQQFRRIASTSINKEADSNNDHWSFGFEKDGDLSSRNFISKDVSVAFNAVNKAAKNITMEMLELRTRNTELEANLKKLKEENQAFRDFYVRLKKHSHQSGGKFNNTGFGNTSSNQMSPGSGANASYDINSPDGANSSSGGNFGNFSSTNSVSGTGASDGDDANGNFDVVVNDLDRLVNLPSDQKTAEYIHQLETLREMSVKLNTQKTEWTKEYENQKRKLESDEEKLFQKKLQIEKTENALKEKEKKLVEKSVSLQKKIDLYMENGIDLLNMTADPTQGGLQHGKSTASPTTNSTSSVYNIRSSVTTAAMTTPSESNNDSSVHFRSRSDSTTNRYSSTKHSSQQYQHHHPSGTDADQQRAIDTIPNQLRGSLINQALSNKSDSSEHLLESSGMALSLSGSRSRSPRPPSSSNSNLAGASLQSSTTPNTDRRHFLHLPSGGSKLVGSSTYSSSNLSYTNEESEDVSNNCASDSDVDEESAKPKLPPEHMFSAIGAVSKPAKSVASKSLNVPTHLAQKTTKVKKDKKKKDKK